MFNVDSDRVEVLEPPDRLPLQPSDMYKAVPHIEMPQINCNRVLVMDYCYLNTKTSLRDYNNHYEVSFVDSEYVAASDESFSDSL